jgi:hypothetical protein
MRAGLVMSGVLHLALIAAVAVPYQRQAARGETISVELVPVKDTGEAFKDPPPAPQSPPREDTQPDWSKLRLDPGQTNAESGSRPPKQEPQQKAAAIPPAQQPQQQQAAPSQQPAPQPPQAQQQLPAVQPSQPAQPLPRQAAVTPMQPMSSMLQPFPQAVPSQSTVPPELTVDTIEDQGKRISKLMNLPEPNSTDGFGSEADAKAKLEVDDIAKFKAHLRSCWTLPSGVSPTQKLKLIVRVALRKDGSLASDPALIEAPASALGPPLFMSAISALKNCAPYTMLPVAKYNEWRVLDLNFSPDQMAGG